MNHAKRAAIASAFIFPGAGQFLLKHYIRGCVFAIPAVIIIGAIFYNMLTTAQALSNEMAGQIPNSAMITRMFTELHNAAYHSTAWNEGKWVLLASWILSIVSAYFIGKKMDEATSTLST